MKIAHRNMILTAMMLGFAAYALAAPDLAAETRTAVVTGALAFVTGLWIHSGRRPPAALLALVLAACNGGVLSWDPILPHSYLRPLSGGMAIQGGISADSIQMTPQASNPIASGFAGIYAKNTDNLPRFVDAAGVERKAGEAWALRQSSGTPSPVTEGDIWYDTGTHALVYRDNSGNVSLLSGSLYMALAGTQTATGAKTFTGGLTVSTTALTLTADTTTTDDTYDLGDATHRFQQIGLKSVLPGSSSLTISPAVADGASAVSLLVNNTVSLSNAAARLASFRNNGTEGAAIRYDGALLAPSAGTSFSAQHAFPSGTGALCSVDATQTLTNKTLTAPVLGGTVTGTYTLGGTPTIPASGLSGTVAKANGGTGEDNSTGGTANTVWARPNGSTGAASYRLLADADIPTLTAAKISGGTFGGVVALASAASNPAGANGQIFYNSTDNKFRCYENGAWADCIGSGGGTGVAWTDVFYSPVNRVRDRAQTPYYQAGDYTLGVVIQVMKSGLSMSGVRYHWDGTVGKTIKCAVWSDGGTLLASGTGTAATGVNTCTFGSPLSISSTYLSASLRVSIYQTDGLNYCVYALSDYGFPAAPYLASPAYQVVNAGVYEAGDAAPVTTSLTGGYAIEPVF